MTQTFSTQADEPRIVQEDIEWCDVWLPHLNDHDLPRVLLIGDSITKSYYAEVEKLLKDKAYVGHIATSRAVGEPTLLKELDTVLGSNRFDIVHFNNGLHGWDYSEAEYEQYFPGLIATIRRLQPQAKLIWAATTPVRVVGNITEFEHRTERVKARNAIAAKFAAEAGIPINDLFQLGAQHAEYYSPDGVHFAEEGTSALARQVVAAISAVL